jgi:hypothetical protein
MSSRAKRKFDIDPNASDPDDYDYDATERAPPQRRRNRHTPGAKKKAPKRQRRAYGGSDVDDDDEIVSDDSFTDRSESEEPEINPATGRSVRRATKKQIKYEESEEDEIEDTPSEGDGDKPIATSRRRAQPSIEEVEKPSLIVKLKMPDHASGRSLRTRTGSKSIARGKTPDVLGARRSSRLSHDVEAPMVALSDSGKHVNIVREGTRSPDPVISRATRGGKGPRVQHPSAIMEASQETSMLQDEVEDSPGPLDKLLDGPETQVQASKESSPLQEAQGHGADEEDDDEDMGGVIQESQPEGAAEDSEEEGPVTRGGRNLRVSYWYCI